MKLKLGLIGCGRIANKHIEAVVNNYDGIELVAISDILPERMKEIGDKYIELCIAKGIKGNKLLKYEDYKEMLNEDNLDIIAITTESGKHASIAIDCLKAKKHIIIEKPMALSTADAEAIIQVAKEEGKKIAVCHQNRFNPPIQKLRRAIESEKFGKLIHGVASIRWNRNDQYYKQASWRGTWAQDGGTLMNQCIHNIDLLQWMMGPIDTVYAQTDTFLRNIEAEDCGVAVIRFKNGALGIIEGSACIYPRNLEETLSIFGERGTACIGGIAVNKIENWQFANNENDNIKDLLNAEDPDSVYGEGHIPFYKDMIDAIKHNREPYINGEEGKKALEIVLAIYESSDSGQPVKMPVGNVSTLDFKK